MSTPLKVPADAASMAIAAAEMQCLLAEAQRAHSRRSGQNPDALDALTERLVEAENALDEFIECPAFRSLFDQSPEHEYASPDRWTPVRATAGWRARLDADARDGVRSVRHCVLETLERRFGPGSADRFDVDGIVDLMLDLDVSTPGDWRHRAFWMTASSRPQAEGCGLKGHDPAPHLGKAHRLSADPA